MIRRGLQLPFFTSGDLPDHEIFPTVRRSARAAERAGFDSIFAMDHVHQLPGFAPVDDPMLEAYVLLGALAASTQSVRLGTLVTGNTFRNPALLAKIVTTLDVVSSGRAILGLGAGWFEHEHNAYGWDFGTWSERFDRLDEALQIVLPMLRDERPSFAGRHYHVEEAINRPLPVREGGIPLLLGGAGEKRTLRLAAQHAQYTNWPIRLEDVGSKHEVLLEHLGATGRSRAEIEVSVLAFLFLAPTHDAAVRIRDAHLGALGTRWEDIPDDPPRRLKGRFLVGDPDTICERIQVGLDAGIDGIVVNMPVVTHDPEAIALAGETLAMVLDG